MTGKRIIEFLFSILLAGLLFVVVILDFIVCLDPNSGWLKVLAIITLEPYLCLFILVVYCIAKEFFE